VARLDEAEAARAAEATAAAVAESERIEAQRARVAAELAASNAQAASTLAVANAATANANRDNAAALIAELADFIEADSTPKPLTGTTTPGPTPNVDELLAQARQFQCSTYVCTIGDQFFVDGEPFRFIGVSIRGLIHYGYDSNFFPYASSEQRWTQLAAAYQMGARVVQINIAHKDANPEEVAQRFRHTLDIIEANFPGMYITPVLTNKLGDVPFYVQGDSKFYTQQQNSYFSTLSEEFFQSGYKENYLPFVRYIVAEFQNDPRIFAWQIGSELDLPGNPNLIIDFHQEVADVIREVDQNHLITTGLISTHQLGIDHNLKLRADLYGHPNIDFITIHTYDGQDQDNDSDLAHQINKPFILESGISTSEGERPPRLKQDLEKWFNRGANGYIQWGFTAGPMDNGDGDNLVGLMEPAHADFHELYSIYQEFATDLTGSNSDSK
jgi:hypothetical protein